VSYREARNWLYYIEENGSISPVVINRQLREQMEFTRDQMEFTSAKISYYIMRSVGVKDISLFDFIPDKLKEKYLPTEEVSGEPASIADVFKFLQSVSKK